MSNRRKAPPPPDVEYHIDVDDDRGVEIIAQTLLYLTQPRGDAAPEAERKR